MFLEIIPQATGVDHQEIALEPSTLAYSSQDATPLPPPSRTAAKSCPPVPSAEVIAIDSQDTDEMWPAVKHEPMHDASPQAAEMTGDDVQRQLQIRWGMASALAPAIADTQIDYEDE